MTQELKMVAHATMSPFDSIRQFEDEYEYWSARDLQELMGYVEWRKFEDAIERAMIACRNSGHGPESNFVLAAKVMKKGRYGSYTVDDYHLSRYACYLVAMNSDPRKEAVSQAQTYFAMKTRQAEVSQPPQQSIHTLTEHFRPRALENLQRVPEGYFSVMGELFKHLYNLEALINRSLDENAMIEISVGLCWSRYAREVLSIPDQHRCKYAHVCLGGRVEQVWAYELHYVTTFDQWLWEVYFPRHFPDYERYRTKYLAARVAPKKGLLHPKNRHQSVQQARFFLE